MAKVNYKTLMMIAESVNFSDLGRNQNDETVQEFDAGDNGRADDEIASNMQADSLLLTLLFGFNDRQKVILLYQILREAGYNLNHGDCAKTLSLTREHYMFLVSEVKKKARRVLQEAGV